MTISKDLRQRVVTAYMDGKGTMDEIADIFGISKISVKRWVKIYRNTGEYMTGRISEGRPRTYTPEDEVAIIALFEEYKSLTLVDASDIYCTQTGKRFHTEIISRILRYNNWTRKKRVYVPLNNKPKRFKS